MACTGSGQLSLGVGKFGSNKGLMIDGYVLLLFSTQLLFGKVVIVYGAPQTKVGFVRSRILIVCLHPVPELPELSVAIQSIVISEGALTLAFRNAEIGV